MAIMSVNQTEFLFIVDLCNLSCLYCDASFYKDVCDRFIKSTVYEDGYDILDYFCSEDAQDTWEGFPDYIKSVKHIDLFEIFNYSISGRGLLPSPFTEGDKIHPMFIEVIRNTGYQLIECSIVFKGKEHYAGLVKLVQ